MVMFYHDQIIHLQLNIRVLLLHNELVAFKDLIHINLTITIALAIIIITTLIITTIIIIIQKVIKERINIDNHSALTLSQIDNALYSIEIISRIIMKN